LSSSSSQKNSKQIAIDLGQRRTKVHAEAMARGWGDVTLHPTPRDAIINGLYERWSWQSAGQIKMLQTCNTAVPTRQKAVMVTCLDHDGIMEEAMKRDVLEYDGNKEE
jgi:hypothetical protein